MKSPSRTFEKHRYFNGIFTGLPLYRLNRLKSRRGRC